MGSLTKALVGKEDCDIQGDELYPGTFSRLNSAGSTINLRSFPDVWKSHQSALNAKYYGDHTATNATITTALGLIDGVTDSNALYIEAGTWTISDNLDISSYTDIQIIVAPGAVFNVATGKTLTIYSPANISASPNQQIFSGSGTVSFSAGGSVHPEWWGVDGTADDVQINAAFEAIPRGDVILLPNTYYTTGTINIKTHRKSLKGSSQQTSIIRFTPASDIPAIHVYNSASATTVAQNILRGFAIDGTGSTQTKEGIRLTDAEEPIIEDIAISNFTSTGIDCIGLQLRGRQLHTIRNMIISTDIPISIEDNPNNSIDIDHYHFQDMYLIGTDLITNPLIKVASGVNLTNVIFDGYQTWNKGTHGFYWNDTTTTAAGSGLTIKNVRLEQQTDATAYMVYIKHNYLLQNVILESIFGGIVLKGYYLRKTRNVTIQNSYYNNTSSAVGIDADETVYDLTLINNNWASGTTATLSGQNLILGVSTDFGAMDTTAVYKSDSQTRFNTLFLNRGLGSGVWDFDVDGGTQKAYALSIIPDNATITRAWYETITDPTSGGGSSMYFGISTNDTTGIIANTAFDDAVWNPGYHDTICDGTAANFTTKSTAIRNVQFVIANADLTAGKIYFYWEYIVSE